MKTSSFFLLFFFLFACSSDVSPAITKKDVVSEEANPKPELVENEIKENNEEKVQMVLEFNLPNEQVTINLDGIEILNEYLTGASNRQEQIDKMILTPVKLPEYDTLYLLQFSCYNDNCSYLLLDQKDEGRSFLLADLSKILKFAISDDNNKLLMVFRRINEEGNLILQKDNLLVIDLDSWETLSVSTNSQEKFANNYKVPIMDANWNQDHSITISTPRLKTPTEENLIKWYESIDKTTKNQKLFIEGM
ncbi:hypothetical protein [Aquibacillus saliphilus]|uniref:hypothetical protein n=1 Tax=Aquibacillus saliphilus TaxID=1909422 RepID=UPI001CF03BDA|nr:hypothetical protein [Aquibacillus saliphilus]